MTEEVDPEIAAALAKLAQQDAGSVDNAEAALEWIVGELGLRPSPRSTCRTSAGTSCP
jgi:hypothetical protein